jgi:hypothetical protein
MFGVETRFVMPAKAGIHLGSQYFASTQMDSGMRRNDGPEI